MHRIAQAQVLVSHHVMRQEAPRLVRSRDQGRDILRVEEDRISSLPFFFYKKFLYCLPEGAKPYVGPL
jgi:hypothetical protein